MTILWTIRQGNENAEITIFTYVTERTFDAYSYQILENKQRFISQINRGEFTVREASDIDETTFSYAEIKAITSANPLIKRKNEIELELSNLRVLQSQYQTTRYALQDSITNTLPKEIQRTQTYITNLEQDLILRDTFANPDFAIHIAGKLFTDRKSAAELLHSLTSNSHANKPIAVFCGFEIIPEFSTNLLEKYVILKANNTYRLSLSDSPLGSLTRLENFISKLESTLTTAQQNLSTLTAQLTAAKNELNKPFDHTQTILTLTTELTQIETELNLDKQEITIVIDDNEDQKKESKEIEENLSKG